VIFYGLTQIKMLNGAAKTKEGYLLHLEPISSEAFASSMVLI